MFIALYKIDRAKNQHRWYVLSVQPTLFGEWAFVREWGRIGNSGGQQTTAFFDCEADALNACELLKILKIHRGYIVQPQQLTLSL